MKPPANLRPLDEPDRSPEHGLAHAKDERNREAGQKQASQSDDAEYTYAVSLRRLLRNLYRNPSNDSEEDGDEDHEQEQRADAKLPQPGISLPCPECQPPYPEPAVDSETAENSREGEGERAVR